MNSSFKIYVFLVLDEHAEICKETLRTTKTYPFKDLGKTLALLVVLEPLEVAAVCSTYKATCPLTVQKLL